MIKTNLKKILTRTSKSQTAAAKELGITPSRFSDICNGRAFFDEAEFRKFCDTFAVLPTDVYEEDVLEVVYGGKPEKKKAASSVQVRVSMLNIEYIDILVENGIYESRCEAVNAILNQKRRQCSGWSDIENGDDDGCPGGGMGTDG